MAIFDLVRTFKRFTQGNDPHEEHDFGIVEHAGNRIYLKIDYYATDLKSGSDDPSDPDQTIRVMTIMLACEH